MRRVGAVGRGLLLTALFLLAAVLLPAVSAGFGIVPGSVQVRFLDAEGNPDNRAGAHPDRLMVGFELDPSDGGSARDLVFDFAPGLAGSPIATKACPRSIFEFEECPADTEVGRFESLDANGSGFDQPVFNVEPAPNRLAAMGFSPFWRTTLDMSLRPDDFGLTVATYDMPQLLYKEGQVELWGIPADHNGAPPSERAAFLTTPTRCGPLGFVLRVRSWEAGSSWLSEAAESEPIEGCEGLPFEPSLGLRLTNSSPDTPTGARIDFNLTEHGDPDELAGANLRDVKLDLPPGLTVSPGGVEGRESCDDAQFGLGKNTPVACPFHSRVGTVEVNTPQLASNLVGPIFLGRERPGERFRLFVEAAAPGVEYRAVTRLVADPQTGQLSASLTGLPQFPSSRISLDLEGGPHALLATPVSCGRALARARFVPDSGGGAVNSSTPVTIGAPCVSAPSFAPGLAAGSTDTRAGHSTAFALTLSRRDGEQLPGKLSTTFPPGLSANLTAVDRCSAAAAAAALCPAASRIGSAVGEVGSGPSPAKVDGAVYLTDGYKGAPFGLSIVYRAAIGPFDLGVVNVRAALRLDPQTGQVTIETALPSIFGGVPLRFRTIGLDLTREGLLVNPTSCEPARLQATVLAVDGRAASVVDPFQVSGCDALGFRPKVSVALDRRARRAHDPRLSFTVKMPRRQANIKRFQLRFSRLLEFHKAGIGELCARADAAEDHCRAGSRVGTAVADSPLLDEPLRGPVYVVQPEGGGFPDLWSNLAGMGVKLQMRSESSGNRGSLVTDMVDIPDLPLSSFTMRIDGGGGSGALFSVAGNACARPGALATPVELEGHNGALRTLKVQMKAGCSKADRSKRAAKQRASRRDR